MALFLSSALPFSCFVGYSVGFVKGFHYNRRGLTSPIKLKLNAVLISSKRIKKRTERIRRITEQLYSVKQ